MAVNASNNTLWDADVTMLREGVKIQAESYHQVSDSALSVPAKSMTSANEAAEPSGVRW